MSRTVDSAEKWAGTISPADTGSYEAIIRPHLAPLAQQRSWKIFDGGIMENSLRPDRARWAAPGSTW